jgi:hypothetical protein
MQTTSREFPACSLIATLAAHGVFSASHYRAGGGPNTRDGWEDGLPAVAWRDEVNPIRF